MGVFGSAQAAIDQWNRRGGIALNNDGTPRYVYVEVDSGLDMDLDLESVLIPNPSKPFTPYLHIKDDKESPWTEARLVWEDCSFYEKWMSDDLSVLRANGDGRLIGFSFATASTLRWKVVPDV